MLLKNVSNYNKETIAYECFRHKELNLEQVDSLLLELDFLGIPHFIISGLARLYIELSDGTEIALESFSDVVKKVLNRYFYLFYGRYLDEQKPAHYLRDLFEFKRIDKDQILSERANHNKCLKLSELSLGNVFAFYKLLKYDIDPSKLTIITLNHNYLQKAPPHLLHCCPKLMRLALNTNQLTEIPQGFLSKCPLLEYVLLNANELTEIPDDLVRHCPRIEHLSLAQNKSQGIPDSVVSDCFNIKTLWVNNNRLVSFPWHLLIKLNHLTMLFLMNNNFPIIDGLPEHVQEAIRVAQQEYDALETQERALEGKDETGERPAKRALEDKNDIEEPAHKKLKTEPNT